MRRRAMLMVVAMVGVLVVGSGVALAASFTCTANPCIGTADADRIRGTDNPETIHALAGNDYVNALGGGQDTVHGNEGNDILDAGLGNDTVLGDEDNDIIDGYAGDDLIFGGPDGDGSAEGAVFSARNLEGGEDSDTVFGGGGSDFIDAAANDNPSESQTEPVDRSYGQGGNDRINAVDGNVDIIDCGKGRRDVARIDKGIDTTTRCEKKVAGV